jgi:hypothetical protein
MRPIAQDYFLRHKNFPVWYHYPPAGSVLTDWW